MHTEDVCIPVADAVVAGTLLVPSDAWPCSCIVLVPGSGANDRDETVCGHKPFLRIAHYFASRGYAVLRCDARGVGDSTGDVNAQDFDGSVADIKAVCAWLIAHPAIDANRLILFGHSEGGLIAAAAGQDVKARAVIMLAGPSTPIESLLHEQAKAISEDAGASQVEIEHERRMNERVFALARSELDRSEVEPQIIKVIRQHLLTWPDAQQWEHGVLNDSAQLMADVICAPPYRSLLRQVPATLIDGYAGNLLALYGGKDTQVPGVESAEAFRPITAGRGQAKVLFFPEHNHLFQVDVTGAISEYECLGPAPADDVLCEISGWLAAV